MSDDLDIKAVCQNVQDGPPIQSVVLQRLSHRGIYGYEVQTRREGAFNLQPIWIAVASSDTDPHELYDAVFDVMYTCVSKVMNREMRLF